jgi:hypothetical protein
MQELSAVSEVARNLAMSNRCVEILPSAVLGSRAAYPKLPQGGRIKPDFSLLP